VEDSKVPSIVRTTPSDNDLPQPVVEFIFVVGLEGTGHHFLKRLVDEMPHPLVSIVNKTRPKRERKFNTLFVNEMQSLQNHLYYHSYGVMNTHCMGNTTSNVSNITTSNQKRFPDARESFDEVVQSMKSIVNQTKLVLAEALRLGTPQTQPVRLVVNGGAGRMQMASYPYNKGDCRSLHYPILDLFYQACQQADASYVLTGDASVHVQCGHVYLYRDPYAILQSTLRNRPMNTDVTQAMHLYTSMLYIIHGQFTKFGNGRYDSINHEPASSAGAHLSGTRACLGFFDGSSNNNVTFSSTNQRYLWGPLSRLVGWQDDPLAFQKVVEGLYRPPKVITQATKDDLVPEHLSMYMTAFLEAHDMVLDLCRRQEAQNMLA